MQDSPKNMTTPIMDGSANWLRQLYIERRRKNPIYSLRAFARYLDVPAPRLCDIFSGKRLLTPGMARIIAKRLELKPKQTHELLACVAAERSLSGKTKHSDARFSTLQNDIFESVAGWYHSHRCRKNCRG